MSVGISWVNGDGGRAARWTMFFIDDRYIEALIFGEDAVSRQIDSIPVAGNLLGSLPMEIQSISDW
jgi:hypothetical protein